MAVKIKRGPRRRITLAVVRFIVEHPEWTSAELGEKFNLNRCTISRIRTGNYQSFPPGTLAVLRGSYYYRRAAVRRRNSTRK